MTWHIQPAQNVFVEDRSLALVVVASDVDDYESYYHSSASNTAPEDDLGASETISAPVIVTCVAMATYSAHYWDRVKTRDLRYTLFIYFTTSEHIQDTR